MAFSPLPIVDFNRNPLDVSPLTDSIQYAKKVEFQNKAHQLQQNAQDMDRQRLGFEKNRLDMAAEMHPIAMRSAQQQTDFAKAAEARSAEVHPLAMQVQKQQVEAGADAADRRRLGIYGSFINDQFNDPKSPTYQADPGKRAENWAKFRAAHLDDMPFLKNPHLRSMFEDDKLGPQMVASMTRKSMDPLERRKLEAEIGKLDADAIESRAKATALGNKGTGYENLNQYANTAEGMRKEFQALPQVKGYENVRGAADRLTKLVASSKEGKFGTGAGDIAMVFNFMKTLDPESIVMPGEAATARNAPGVSENLLNYYNYLRTGQFLTAETRNDFLKVVNSELESRKATAVQEARRYRGLARGVQVNPEHIVPRTFAGVDLDGDGRPDVPQESLGQQGGASTQRQGAAQPQAGGGITKEKLLAMPDGPIDLGGQRFMKRGTQLLPVEGELGSRGNPISGRHSAQPGQYVYENDKLYRANSNWLTDRLDEVQ